MPLHLEPVLPNKRGSRNEKLVHHNEEQLLLPQLEKAQHSDEDPVQWKIYK